MEGRSNGSGSASSTRVDDADPLDRLARSLDRATAAEQWEVAKGIIRQLERIELSRAGVPSLEDERRRRGR